MIKIKKEDYQQLSEEELYNRFQNLSESRQEIIKLISQKMQDPENQEKYREFRDKVIKENQNDKLLFPSRQLHNQQRDFRKLNFFQRFREAFSQDIDVDPGRLMGLTDGIFGMVMTLLIFGMALPEYQLLSAGDFSAFIVSLLPTIGNTLVSFVLLSSFWIYHHEFIKINNLNIPFLWLNIFFLACISFIPFTTSLIGNYSQFFQAEYIFGINVFLTILSFLLVYNYAYNREFLENMPSREERGYILHTFIIIMLLTMVVNILDFRVSSNFIYLFFLVPVISTLRDVRFRELL